MKRTVKLVSKEKRYEMLDLYKNKDLFLSLSIIITKRFNFVVIDDDYNKVNESYLSNVYSPEDIDERIIDKSWTVLNKISEKIDED